MGPPEGHSSSGTTGYIFGMVARFSRSENIGYLFGLAAGVCYGAWSVITKTAITDYDIPPLLFAAATFAFGTFMFAPLLVYSAPRAFKSSKQALGLFALSGLGGGVAVIALSFGLQKGDVSVVGPILSASPLINPDPGTYLPGAAGNNQSYRGDRFLASRGRDRHGGRWGHSILTKAGR